ncbi:hypothetical protein [Halegenticoccus tardaugens]|uniref:hypothetical protein n=1 Tax=Halegenticoccus tardaugens TaxID=2071624 RepID=UPI00100B3CCE|nr:hypothetical protein [Halegenticoccus tardaugens]
MTDESPRIHPATRKSTLFCQVCRHASLVNGDWRLRTETDGTVRYVCPACGHVVAERPAFEREAETDGEGRASESVAAGRSRPSAPVPLAGWTVGPPDPGRWDADPARWAVGVPSTVALWTAWVGYGGAVGAVAGSSVALAAMRRWSVRWWSFA